MIGINNIKITAEMMFLASDIDRFAGLWDGLSKYTTELNLMREVARYGSSLDKAVMLLKTRSVTPDIICRLHGPFRDGTKTSVPYRTTRTRLPIRNEEIAVGSLEIADPEDIEKLLEKLCDWLKTEQKFRDLPPLLAIAVFTAVFLQISPFEQGNKKMACLLATILLVKEGYGFTVYERLDRSFKKEADWVLLALKKNRESLDSGQPHWETWCVCFLSMLKNMTSVLEERLRLSEENLSSLPTLSSQIMALFKQGERVSMKEIIQKTGGRRSTLKLRLKELLEQGYLRRHGQARSTWYSRI